MVIYQDFDYRPAHSNRCLHIYLPDDYEFSQERYPVMYMFDGQNLFFDDHATYGKSWGLADFMKNWDKKLIIVGMECSHTGNERLNEYSPYRKKMFGEWFPGIGEQTFQWIINDVKPFIDQNFRTWGHREATAISGSSMGGIMSLYGVMAHNDVFSKAACVSTGVFWNLSNFRKTLSVSQINPDTRIYLSWGEKEAGKAAHNGNPEYDTREARAVRKFEKELQARGANTYLYFQWNGEHREADWEKQDPVFMNYLWK